MSHRPMLFLAAWLALAGVQEAAARTPASKAPPRAAGQAACVVALAHDGRARYPNLTPAGVREGFDNEDYHFLSETRLGLDIACGAPVALVLTATDLRAGSRPPAERLEADRFGLGTLNGRPIGVFALSLDQPEAAASAGRRLAPVHRVLVRGRDAAAAAWTASSEEPPVPLDTRHAFAFASRADGDTPMALVRLRAQLEVIVMVAKAWLGHAKSTIPIDGSVVIALEYV